ncbi:MAG: uroporphyrinogen-III synthase [Thermoplasmata archaeon]
MEKRNFLITTRPSEKNRQIIYAPCFEIKNVPLTRIVRSVDTEKLRDQLEKYSPNFVVLTSSIGSEVFLKAAIRGSFTIMCIGKKTAGPFLQSGQRVLVASEQNSSGLVKLISQYSLKESRIALCRSKQHNTILDEYLASEGFNFRCFDLYEIEELHPPDLPSMLNSKECKGMILTSSVETISFAHLLGNDIHSIGFMKKIFCIGKPTYETATRLGFECEVLSNQGDVDAIIEEISKKHCNSGEWI